MKKHAFLIMAHNDYALLRKLVALLDDERADIYLHIDKRSDKPEGVFARYSNLYFITSKKIIWGGYSQIDCEMRLLAAALPQKYQYYHLLSGADLPLVTNDELNEFFDESTGKNFLSFDPSFIPDGVEVEGKLRYYRFFQDGGKRGAKRIFNRVSLAVQKLLKVNRLKKLSFPIYKGANWFSITHELAEYVVGQKKTVEKFFKRSLCADEMFLHTLAMASPFRDTVTGDALRYTDWAGGDHPKTFTVEDYDRILSSKCFFARKFSTETDREVVERICAHVRKQTIKE